MQVLVVVPVHLSDLAEQAVSLVTDQSDGRSFVTRLQEPITHVACQPNVTRAVLDQITTIASQPEFSGSSVFVASSDADHLPMIARSLDSLNLFICE